MWLFNKLSGKFWSCCWLPQTILTKLTRKFIFMYFNLCFPSFFFHLKCLMGHLDFLSLKMTQSMECLSLPFKNKDPGRFYGISYLPHSICWLRHVSLKKIRRREPAWEPCRPVDSWMVSTVGQMFTLTPSGCLGGNVHEGTKPKGKGILPGSGTFWAQSSLCQERTQPALGQVWAHLDVVISGRNMVFVPGTNRHRLLAIQMAHDGTGCLAANSTPQPLRRHSGRWQPSRSWDTSSPPPPYSASSAEPQSTHTWMQQMVPRRYCFLQPGWMASWTGRASLETTAVKQGMVSPRKGRHHVGGIEDGSSERKGGQLRSFRSTFYIMTTNGW